MAAQSIEKHTLVAKFDFGMVESKTRVPYWPKGAWRLLKLIGNVISRNSLIDKNLAYGSLIHRYKWFEMTSACLSRHLHRRISEHGGVWSNNWLSLDEAPMFTAGSLFAGDSPIGPIILAYGKTEGNYDSVYLIIGTSY